MEVTTKTAVGLCMLSRGVCTSYGWCEDLHTFLLWLALADMFMVLSICIMVCNPPLRSGYACVWTIYQTSSAANNSGRGSHVLVL